MTKFTYIIETVAANGVRERAVEEIVAEEIKIGRGPACQIMLAGRLVSLEHAVLREHQRGLVVEDLASLGGVRVNNRLVPSQMLKPGDTVQIGGFSFDVFRENDVWGFLQVRKAVEKNLDLENAVETEKKALLFQNRLPSLSFLSYFFAAIVFILFAAMPLGGYNQSSWDSGPISNAHKMLENDCEQCHSSPFVQVKDDDCLACHSLSEHSKDQMASHATSRLAMIEAKDSSLSQRCATCHMEHNGDAGLIAKETTLCSNCHSGLSNYLEKVRALDVPSFDGHPEFRVSLPAVLQGEAKGRREKVSLDTPHKLIDSSNIKLNHKVHLAPDLAGKDGLVTLGCNDCHRPSDDFRGFKPFEFERDCADCHSLEFDEKLRGKTVPHGEPAVVYSYLYAEYSKLFLELDGKESETARKTFRRIPGKQLSREEKVEFAREAVQKKAREVEAEVFTRTSCSLCHSISEKEEPVQGLESKFDVVSPNIPDHWMPAARYDHGAHQEISCESCHAKARASVETTDILMPKIAQCRQCHEQNASRGMVESTCVSCHSYHDVMQMSEDKKRAVESILLSDK